MSLKDGEMQAISVLGSGLGTVVLVLLVVHTKKAPEQHINLDNMTVIEASVAYKRSPSRQPQKHFKAPDPVQKPEGVSHDENKHVDKKPDDKDKKPPKKADTDPFAKFKHPHDDDQDAPVGPVTMPQVGDLNGSIDGNAAVSKGDPYLGGLMTDMHFEAPSIAKASGSPIGCIALQPDGKIRDYTFKQTTNDDIQLAAEAALKRLKKARDEKPQEVPTRLLRLTGHYICFTFNLK